MKIWGLKTCDTCRKALRELRSAGLAPEFQDVRESPPDFAALFQAFGPALINTRSTTWRNLTEEERAGPLLPLLRKHPTLMKRPVITDGSRRSIGWDRQAKQVWDI